MVGAKVSNYIFVFDKVQNIKVNQRDVFETSKDEKIFDAETLNTKASTILLVNGKEYKTKLRKISKDNFIKIVSIKGREIYKIRTLPLDFPKYEFKTEKGHTPGYLFVTVNDDRFLDPKYTNFERNPIAYALCMKTGMKITSKKIIKCNPM